MGAVERLNMQLTVSKNEFAQALRHVAPVAKSGAPNPILSNILLTARDGTLELYATDMVLGVRSTCGVSVAVPGSIVTPARQLLDRVAALPDGTVHVQQTGGQLVLKSGERVFQLNSSPGDEYPQPPTAPESGWVDAPAADLARAIAMVRHAMADDDARVVGNMELSVKDGTCRVAALDGSRMALAEFPWGAELEPILVHRRCVAELAKLTDGSDDVSVCIVGPSLHVRSAGVHMSILCTDGTFPPIDQLIGRSFSGHLVVDRAQILGAAKAVMLSANANSGALLRVGEGSVELLSDAATYARDKISAETNGSTEIGLNYKFLIELLTVAPGDDVQFDFQANDELSPIQLVHRDNGRMFTSVLMPMRK